MGVIKKKGVWTINPIFESITVFDENGFARFRLNKKWGIINRKGKIVIDNIFYLPYVKLYEIDNKGYGRIRISNKAGDKNKCGFYDCSQKKWQVKPSFDCLFKCDSYETAKVIIKNKTGFIDRMGNWKIKPIFDAIDCFINKEADALLNEKWGKINLLGNWIENVILDLNVESRTFYRFSSIESQKVGVINLNSGIWIIPPIYEKIYAFDAEFAYAKLNTVFVKLYRSGNYERI